MPLMSYKVNSLEKQCSFSVIISFGLVMRETRFGKVIQSPHSPDSENHELYFLISRDNISQNVFFIPKVGKKKSTDVTRVTR